MWLYIHDSIALPNRERSDIPPREIEIELIFPTMGVDIRMEGAKCCNEEANHLEMLL